MPMKEQPSSSSVDVTDVLTRVTVILVAVVIVMIPFAITSLLWIEEHSAHINYDLLGWTTTGPFDAILLLVAVASLPLLFRRDTYRGIPIGLIGLIAFTVITCAWILVDPSLQGVARTVRLAGITGVVVTVRHMSLGTFRNAVVWPITISAIVQATLGLLQTHLWNNGTASSITARFDHAWTQGYGTMDGGYALAAFLVVASGIILASGAFRRLHPAMWVAVGLSSAAISTTFGRLGVLSMIGIAAFYGATGLIRRNREYVSAALVAIVPVTAGIAYTWVGWSVRASETAAGFTSGRETLMSRATTMIEMHPFVGVGPGNYGPTLARIGLVDVDYTIVHNVGVLVTAEYGIPVGVMFSLWVATLGIASILTSVRAMAVFASIVPYLMLDHTHMSYAYAMGGFGLWIATLDYLRLHRNETRDGRYGAKATAPTSITPELQPAG